MLREKYPTDSLVLALNGKIPEDKAMSEFGAYGASNSSWNTTNDGEGQHCLEQCKGAGLITTNKCPINVLGEKQSHPCDLATDGVRNLGLLRSLVSQLPDAILKADAAKKTNEKNMADLRTRWTALEAIDSETSVSELLQSTAVENFGEKLKDQGTWNHYPALFKVVSDLGRKSTKTSDFEFDEDEPTPTSFANVLKAELVVEKAEAVLETQRSLALKKLQAEIENKQQELNILGQEQLDVIRTKYGTVSDSFAQSETLLETRQRLVALKSKEKKFQEQLSSDVATLKAKYQKLRDIKIGEPIMRDGKMTWVEAGTVEQTKLLGFIGVLPNTTWYASWHDDLDKEWQFDNVHTVKHFNTIEKQLKGVQTLKENAALAILVKESTRDKENNAKQKYEELAALKLVSKFEFDAAKVDWNDEYGIGGIEEGARTQETVSRFKNTIVRGVVVKKDNKFKLDKNDTAENMDFKDTLAGFWVKNAEDKDYTGTYESNGNVYPKSVWDAWHGDFENATKETFLNNINNAVLITLANWGFSQAKPDLSLEQGINRKLFAKTLSILREIVDKKIAAEKTYINDQAKHRDKEAEQTIGAEVNMFEVLDRNSEKAKKFQVLLKQTREQTRNELRETSADIRKARINSLDDPINPEEEKRALEAVEYKASLIKTRQLRDTISGMEQESVSPSRAVSMAADVNKLLEKIEVISKATKSDIFGELNDRLRALSKKVGEQRATELECKIKELEHSIKVLVKLKNMLPAKTLLQRFHFAGESMLSLMDMVDKVAASDKSAEDIATKQQFLKRIKKMMDTVGINTTKINNEITKKNKKQKRLKQKRLKLMKGLKN